MKTESINTPNFTGIYKIQLTNLNIVDKKISKLISEQEHVYRQSEIFSEGKDKFIYAITSDNKIEENMFEDTLRQKQIPYWKTLPINTIINKNIIDVLFKITKKIQGHENWMI